MTTYTGTVTYTNWVLNEEAVSTTTAGIATSTSTSTYSYVPGTNVFVRVNLTLESPLNCSNVDLLLDLPLNPDPDIAGIGIILAFLISACSVILLALVAYFGGFLPSHFLKRADRRVFRADSRNEASSWRNNIENMALCFSDQQIVTGLAILIAGYCQMFNTNLSIYHWNVILYLEWLSSSVHIASLTLLRDRLNKNHGLRNFRIAAMLCLLFLLATALWPLHRSYYSGSYMSPSVPIRCMWKRNNEFQRRYVVVDSWKLFEEDYEEYYGIEPNWVISNVLLFGAYLWKIIQLFAPTRNWSRKWLRAKPEAAIERSMRLLADDYPSFGLPRCVTWLAYKLVVGCYISFLVYIELTESFMASIIFVCLTVPWGIVNIFVPRREVGHDVRQGEMKWSFGQIMPLLMLMLPVFSLFEFEKDTVQTADEARVEDASPMAVPPQDQSIDLTTVLLSNDPSDFAKKYRDDAADSTDPVIDHLMRSRAFKVIFWSFFLIICLDGLAVMIASGLGGPKLRIYVLAYGGGPVLLGWVPFATMCALPFSHRLR